MLRSEPSPQVEPMDLPSPRRGLPVEERDDFQLGLDAASLLPSVLETSADGILLADLEGNGRLANHRFGELWGLPKRVMDAIGLLDPAEFISSMEGRLDYPDIFVERARHLLTHSGASSFDFVTLKDGKVLEISSYPLLRNADVVGRIWSVRDVTRLVRIEKDRLKAREQLHEVSTLREQERLQAQFFNLAAHDLGSPLATIRTQTDLLLNGGGANLRPDQRRSLELVQRSLERVIQMAADLRAASGRRPT